MKRYNDVWPSSFNYLQDKDGNEYLIGSSRLKEYFVVHNLTHQEKSYVVEKFGGSLASLGQNDDGDLLFCDSSSQDATDNIVYKLNLESGQKKILSKTDGNNIPNEVVFCDMMFYIKDTINQKIIFFSKLNGEKLFELSSPFWNPHRLGNLLIFFGELLLYGYLSIYTIKGEFVKKISLFDDPKRRKWRVIGTTKDAIFVVIEHEEVEIIKISSDLTVDTIDFKTTLLEKSEYLRNQHNETNKAAFYSATLDGNREDIYFLTGLRLIVFSLNTNTVKEVEFSEYIYTLDKEQNSKVHGEWINSGFSHVDGGIIASYVVYDKNGMHYGIYQYDSASNTITKHADLSKVLNMPENELGFIEYLQVTRNHIAIGEGFSLNIIKKEDFEKL